MTELSASAKFAIDYVLQNEGGFVDDPFDDGGPTNMGVTQHTLSVFRGAPASVGDVKALSLLQAESIYLWMYFKPMGLESVHSEAMQACLLDAGVLYGPVTSVRMAQLTCCVLGKEVEVDGHLGPETAKAINEFTEESFISGFYAQVLRRIEEVIIHNKTNERYRLGWTNRAQRMLTLLKRGNA